jgi:hypothetical protein
VLTSEKAVIREAAFLFPLGQPSADHVIYVITGRRGISGPSRDRGHQASAEHVVTAGRLRVEAGR